MYTTRTLSPWLDIPKAQASESTVRATIVQRVTNELGIITTETEKIAGQVMSQTVTTESMGKDQTQPWQNDPHPTRIVTVLRKIPGRPDAYTRSVHYARGTKSYLEGRPLEYWEADGKRIQYRYTQGTLNGTFEWVREEEGARDYLMIEEIHGVGTWPTVEPIPLQSIKRVTILNSRGFPVIEEAHVCTDPGTDSYELLERVRHTYDGRENRIFTERLNEHGAQKIYEASYTYWRKDWEVDESGVRTDFSNYDAEGRACTVTRAALPAVGEITALPQKVTEKQWDATGRLVFQKISAGGTGPIETWSWEYDTRGRVKKVTRGPLDESQRFVTTTLYGTNSEIVTLPGDGTQTLEEYRYLDGSRKRSAGTGQVEVNYSRAVAGGVVRETIRRGSATVYTEEVVDLDADGNVVREKIPTTVESWRGYRYDEAGRRTEESAGGSTLRAWNYLVENGRFVVRSTKYASPDPVRVIMTDTSFRKIGSAWWSETTSNGVRIREQLSNLPLNVLSVFETEDSDGLVTTTTVTVDLANKVTTRTTILPGISNPVIEKTRAGLLVSSRDEDSPNHFVRITYDSLDRPTTEVNSATGVNTITLYDPVTGQISQVRTTTTYGTYIATYTYFAKNQLGAGLLRTQNFQGQVTSHTYTARGELSAIWGASYPVKYQYDDAGRLWKMSTHRNEPGTDPAAWPAGDVTEWVYHPGTNLVQQKKDATGKGATYAYDALGRVSQRTWQRGVTSTYNFNLADELRTIQYSDGTPQVTLSRNDKGQLSSLTDAIGTRTFSYTMAGRRQSEEMPGGRKLQYSYNAGRKAGYGLWDGTQWLAWGGWGYNASTGQVSGVSTPEGWSSYSYKPGTSWMTSLQYSSQVKITRTPDAFMRLSTIQTGDAGMVSSNPVLRHRYIFDNLNRRSHVYQGNNDDFYWHYTYNGRNEITAGSKRWPDFSLGTVVSGMGLGYTYDAIGNRKYTSVNNRSAAWGAGSRNELTNRNYGGQVPAVDVIGAASINGIVYVNGVEASRQETLFHRIVLGAPNSTQGIWASVEIEEQVDSSAPVHASGYMWIDPALETFTYDDDGNLTQDARWEYEWDGENRLKKMTRRSTGVPANLPPLQLVFKYDFIGRRTEKEVWLRNGGGTYVKQKHFRFDYEGWNLIAETETMTNKRRTYNWGLDLTGTLDEAGGVGGLVFMRDHTTAGFKSYFFGYDGNGNVCALLDPANPGVIVASYEYGPFGEPLRANESLVSANPFRFSTHYMDSETGVLYAKNRYYSPMTGRWLSRDPIEEEGGLNLLAFAGNDHVNSFDPFGFAAKGAKPTLTVTLSRANSGYFNTSGDVKIESDDPKINECCGLPMTWQTLELPWTKMALKIGNNPKNRRDEEDPRPFRTPSKFANGLKTHSNDGEELRSSTPENLAKAFGRPVPGPPRGVNPKDYERAKTTGFNIYQGIDIHAGINSANSLFCPILGKKMIHVKMPLAELRHPYPGVDPETPTLAYVTDGFDIDDSLTSQVEFNSAIACAERIGDKPKIKFVLDGEPKDKRGPKPNPVKR